MANKPANAAQKQWMKDIADFTRVNGLHVLYGAEFAGRFDFQLHHVVGRSGKHNKVHIGHWFIIPVPVELHDPNEQHEFHVGHRKRAFVERFGMQNELFGMMIRYMKDLPFKLPPQDAIDAIMDLRA